MGNNTSSQQRNYPKTKYRGKEYNYFEIVDVKTYGNSVVTYFFDDGVKHLFFGTSGKWSEQHHLADIGGLILTDPNYFEWSDYLCSAEYDFDELVKDNKIVIFSAEKAKIIREHWADQRTTQALVRVAECSLEILANLPTRR